MEGIIVVIAIIVFILPAAVLLSVKNSLSNEIKKLSLKIEELKHQVSKIQQPSTQIKENPVITEQPKITPPIIPVEEKKSVIEQLKTIEPIQQVAKPPIEAVKPEPPVFNPPAPKKNFFERYPNLEKFIGENLINKIGIAILVLGVAIFVKYAIDQDWIGPVGRVMIGVLTGCILIGIAHYLRKSYKAFSSVLLGGGIAIEYFTIAIAFHLYHIIPQPAAFAIMVIITAFTILFSILYDRIEIAVLGILGGFSTPFMLSTGEGNYVILFTYILILDIGMLVLAYFKKWKLVNIVSYVFTILLYGGWLISKVLWVENPPYMGALLFAIAFFLIFFLMNIIYNLKNKAKFNVFDFGILISNTFLFFAAGYALIDQLQPSLIGLFTASIAVFFLICSFVIYKNSTIDKNVIYLLIGLVLTFVSLTAPMQLQGNYITLFWASEAVLLLWLSVKSNIPLIRLGSIVVLVLMAISLGMDWNNIYSYYDATFMNELNPGYGIFNKGFITGLFAAVAILVYRWLLNTQLKNVIDYKVINFSILSTILLYSFTFIIFLVFRLELVYELEKYQFDYSTIHIIENLYAGIFLLALMFLNGKLKLNISSPLISLLAVFNILFYLLSTLESNNILRYTLGSEGKQIDHFLIYHYLNIITNTVLLIYNLKFIQSLNEYLKNSIKVYYGFVVVVLLIFISTELDMIAVISASSTDSVYNNIEISQKVAYPIAWGIFSFVLMSIGMKKKNKMLRIAALVLFLITLIKLFVYDLTDISDAGKIIAFISLGAILLVISFMYQKLKILLVDENQNEEQKHV